MTTPLAEELMNTNMAEIERRGRFREPTPRRGGPGSRALPRRAWAKLRTARYLGYDTAGHEHALRRAHGGAR